jgi:4-amino-4-deoxy-L-arabinose transferase-like glycosyltransferase
MPRTRFLRPEALLLAGALLMIAVLFLTVSARNPPGFYRDESAIAYNAATIAAHGRDEYGARMPLYFRSFGDAKSPLYVYLLAGVFAVTGPSKEAARTLSAVLGLGAILTLFTLALALTRRRLLALAVAVGAALSPWIFEVTRLVFEVALEPLLIALLLLALHRAQVRGWRTRDAVAVGLLLGAIAYDYQAGRVYAVLYAVAIGALFWRRRARGVAVALSTFVLTLGPIVAFAIRHPSELTARANAVGYANNDPWWKVPAVFVKHYLLDLNLWGWAVHGDPNERHHVPGAGSILVVVTLVALAGFVVVLRSRRADAWWRFVVFGALTSPVPAALTVDNFHSLRMIAFPVFYAVLTIPGLELVESVRDRRRRLAIASVLLLAFALEASAWQVVWHRDGPKRGEALEAGFPAAFEGALRRGGPIYARRSDHGAYIDTLFYGLLADRPRASLVILDGDETPPPGSIVVGREGECPTCLVLGRGGDFESYVTRTS